MEQANGGDHPPTTLNSQPSSQSATPATPPQPEWPQDASSGTDAAKQQSKELGRGFRRLEIIQIAIAGALGIIGVFALLLYYGQLRQMTKATDAAKESADAASGANQVAQNAFVRSQRPWVGISRPVRLTQPMLLSPKGINMATLLILKNWGPSPAFHLVVDAGIVTDVGKLKKLLDISCNLAERVERGENNKLVSYGFGQPLFPETEMSQRAEVGDSLPHPNLTVLYLAGCIVYQDQFENLHHTPICLETTRLAKDFTMRDSFINCNGGRDAD